jgi:hypothetical protein
MFIKNASMCAVVLSAVLLSSCATKVATLSVGTKDVDKNIQWFPVIGELKVAEEPVTAVISLTAKEGYNAESAKEAAYKKALIDAQAHVLVDPSYVVRATTQKFFFFDLGTTFVVSVTGFPATYEKFRPMEKGDLPFVPVMKTSSGMILNSQTTGP